MKYDAAKDKYKKLYTFKSHLKKIHINCTSPVSHKKGFTLHSDINHQGDRNAIHSA